MKFRFFNKPVLGKECDVPALITGLVGLAVAAWSFFALAM